jgi:glycosyltransferase involved in cell wall biosynthesis
MSQKIISIVIPVFNEEGNIFLVYQELLKIFTALNEQYDYELIFVDDGSVDKSPEILECLAGQNSKFNFLQFSRNFGKEVALSAGLDVARGDAVVMLDADLQHPVELLPEFIKKWEDGAEVVVGVRHKNKGEGLVKKIGSIFFYKIMNAIGDTKITPSATDYRLLDRKVVLAFRQFTEHGRMTRGLIDWLGFKREYIYFNANERLNGIACYDKIKLIKLALSTIISHSLFPLKLAGYLGVWVSGIFGSAGFLLFLGIYVFHNKFAMSFTGTAQLAIVVVFLVGVILSCLGLVALYIANIQAEVLKRPTYVVRKNSFNSHI